MSTHAPAYLERLNAVKGNFARFIARIPEVPVSTNRNAVIDALTPHHEQVLKDAGINPKLLRRAQQEAEEAYLNDESAVR